MGAISMTGAPAGNRARRKALDGRRRAVPLPPAPARGWHGSPSLRDLENPVMDR